ncbi:MAG: Mur ligase family protein [Candidatus Poseidoniales archaeon]|nr:Mur ligase family protein [Candidatus Poseidoniales archaeon]
MDDREWLMDRRFAGMNLGLERIESLLHKLDNPQSDFPSIHVAGTNGKGTLCAFLSSAAANTGVRVGLFTTPHLVVVEERVRIDGEVIDSQTFDEHLSTIRAAAVEVGKELGEQPTFYECTFAIAMLAFSRAGVERAIIETGLGGEGDATCLVDADLCVITTIGLDHTEILGDTREQIAHAKAGIHRAGIPLVVYHPEDESVLAAIAKIAGEDLYVHQGLGIDDFWQDWYIFAGYIAVSFGWELPSEDINWPGRSTNWPPDGLFESQIRISAAHNADGLQSELMSIQEPTILVIGVTQKANLEEAIAEVTSEIWHMATFRHIIVTEPTSGRNPPVDAEELAELVFGSRLDEPIIEKDPVKALEIAEIMSRQAACGISVMGSVYLVGDLLKFAVERTGGDLWEHLRVH